MSELIKRDEVASALEARRELGLEYEDEVVDALVEKIEKRLDERMRKAPRRHDQPWSPAVPLGSLGIAIPLTGAAGALTGLAGVIAVCVAIVLVNLAYAMRR
jgi:hypothetical protein